MVNVSLDAVRGKGLQVNEWFSLTSDYTKESSVSVSFHFLDNIKVPFVFFFFGYFFLFIYFYILFN